MALSPALASPAGTTALPADTGLPPARPGASGLTPGAASEDSFPFPDRFVPGGTARETVDAAGALRVAASGYRFDETALARAAREEILPAHPPRSAPLPRRESATMLRNLRDAFRSHFGAGHAALGEIDAFAEAFSGNPEMMQTALLLLSLSADEDPVGAREMLRQLRQFADSIGEMCSALGGGADGGGGPTDSGTWRVTVAEANIEASVSAVHERIRVYDEAGGTMTQIDLAAIEVEVRARIELRDGRFVLRAGQEQVQDPLVLDLDGDGIDLRAVEDGVDFDLRGDGSRVRTAFVQGDDALLFEDRNGNGVVDGGRELFGDQEGHAHGFAELAEHDENGDGVLDERDALYERLRLFQDANRDGVNQAEETLTLRQAGVRALHLDYREQDGDDGKGNRLAQVGRFEREDGTSALLADALLRYRT